MPGITFKTEPGSGSTQRELKITGSNYSRHEETDQILIKSKTKSSENGNEKTGEGENKGLEMFSNTSLGNVKEERRSEGIEKIGGKVV